jgi:hypothetical protein
MRFEENQRVRVSKEVPHHRHTGGWEGWVAKLLPKGRVRVRFLNGHADYHHTELEPIDQPEAGHAV